AVRERLEAEGLTGSLSIDFHQPASPRAAFVHRTHPIVAILADHLLEVALDEAPQDTALLDAVARSGAIFTDAVEVRTTVLLLRLRHQLTVTHRHQSRLLLCEETLCIGVSAAEDNSLVQGKAALALMHAEPARNMPP